MPSAPSTIASISRSAAHAAREGAGRVVEQRVVLGLHARALVPVRERDALADEAPRAGRERRRRAGSACPRCGSRLVGVVQVLLPEVHPVRERGELVDDDLRARRLDHRRAQRVRVEDVDDRRARAGSRGAPRRSPRSASCRSPRGPRRPASARAAARSPRWRPRRRPSSRRLPSSASRRAARCVSVSDAKSAGPDPRRDRTRRCRSGG